jgi:serine/threonine protein kinase/WD40 repeat protein
MGKASEPKPASTPNLLALPDGTELVGDFRIKRVLGAGGFGITYLADEIALARLVTIKEYFPSDFAARDSQVATPRSEECTADYNWGLERFIEEAQTLARFVHPNIVRVYRYFRANKTAYMVLHFEEGGSFKSWLKNLKRAPRQAELERIIAPLLDALDIVHAASYLHRDIAPDNIIIRNDGSPVLIDFGSARGEIASHSRTVSALVKPGYSPYEQYATNARQQGPWTDIYALGATLYHAITGKRPPDSPSRMVNDEYVPAREAALSSYRAPFLAAIDAALKLEVTERPQTIAAWRGMLLAPEPKRERGKLGLGRALARTTTARTGKPKAAPAAADAEVVPVKEQVATQPQSLVPSPPDAPQPKGQLLDFIEGLKKHRPGAIAKRSPANANTPAPKPAPPIAEAPPPEPAKQAPLAKPASEPKAAPAAKNNKAKRKSADAPAPTPAARRSEPRPRRVRAWHIKPRQWQSLAFKLAVGLGVTGLAVAYQDSLPRVEGRGASVVSSQATDLTELNRLVGHKGTITAVATGDQGRWIVSAGIDGTLNLWNAGSGALIRTIQLDEGAVTALAVDDKRALTGHKGGAVVLWDLERAEKISAFTNGGAPVTSIAFTADPETFAAADQVGAIATFDLRSPPAPSVVLENPDGAAQTLAAAHTANLLVSAGQERSIKLWRTDMRGGLARMWRGDGQAMGALDIAPDGRLVASGSLNGSVRLWSTGSSRSRRSTLAAHTGRVISLAFAPNGRMLASAGEDGQIKLWDLARGARNQRVFRGHAGAVQAIAFSPDGRRLYSGGADGVVRSWSIAPILARD